MARTTEFYMFSVFFFAAFIGVIALAWLYWTGRRRRAWRAMYTNEDSPYWIRNAMASLPFDAPGTLGGSAFCLGVALNAAPVFIAVAFAVFLVSLEIGFFIVYRMPDALVPGWFREEITSGLVAKARPTRSDWMVLGVVVAISALADAGLVYAFVSLANHSV